MFQKDRQFYKFCAYGFLKNLRFFDPFLLLFLREIGISYFKIGILFSVREISTTLLEIPTGVAADIVGRRKSMLFSFSAYISSFLVFYFFPQYELLLAAMFFFAIGEAFRTGTHKALILEHLRINNLLHLKTEYYGNTRAWSQRGSALSALIAGALVFLSGGYRIVFLGSLIPYVMNFFLLLSYPKKLDGDIRASRKTISWKNFLPIFKNEKFSSGIFHATIFDALFKTIKDYLQPIIRSFAFTFPVFMMLEARSRESILIASVYFCLFLITAQASKSSASFQKRFPNMPQALNFSFLSGGFLVVIIGMTQYFNFEIAAILLFIIYYALENLRRPMNVSFISESIPNQLMATGLSVESQLRTVLIAIFAPIVGFFADTFGVGIAVSVSAIFLYSSYPFVKLR